MAPPLLVPVHLVAAPGREALTAALIARLVESARAGGSAGVLSSGSPESDGLEAPLLGGSRRGRGDERPSHRPLWLRLAGSCAGAAAPRTMRTRRRKTAARLEEALALADAVPSHRAVTVDPEYDFFGVLEFHEGLPKAAELAERKEGDFRPVFCAFGRDLNDRHVAAQFTRFIDATTDQDSPFFPLMVIDAESDDVRRVAATFCALAGADPGRMCLLAVDSRRAASCKTLCAVLRATTLVNSMYARV